MSWVGPLGLSGHLLSLTLVPLLLHVMMMIESMDVRSATLAWKCNQSVIVLL